MDNRIRLIRSAARSFSIPTRRVGTRRREEREEGNKPMQTVLIDDSLLQAVRKISGTGNERKIIEAALRDWLSKHAKPAALNEEPEWQALQRQKALYADRFPPSALESPAKPSAYKGKPLSIEEMQDRAKQAVAERFKDG
jgi:Arc/MetJ family transcription regulator